ncbi:hypothetical protein C8Q75DRAFT_711225 [Abortiporus biennis]|nr:hypothetical protein C8Q75DRAFT_711225 [Abortiporus biennis]
MASDPVAAKSSFLCMYMSNHPDTLVLYVKYWGKVKENVISAQMTAIDTKAMTLTYSTKAGGSAKKEIKVEFDPPLAGYEEVKPRLINMKADAEEALGMALAPQITSFRLTKEVFVTIVMIASLVLTTFAPEPSSPSYSQVFFFFVLLRNFFPSWFIIGSWYFMIAVHSLEALYTLSLCKKHRTPFLVGAGYVISTLLFGYPVFVDIRRQVQAIRIESIMKGQ